jgi:hypothetical protein
MADCHGRLVSLGSGLVQLGVSFTSHVLRGGNEPLICRRNPETSLQEGTDQTEAAAPNEESTTERKERERREMQWEVVMRLVMDGMREPDRRRMRTEYDAENDWAGSNPAPLSVQGMGPGGRQDVFGDGWVDWAASRLAPLEYID